MKKTMTFLLVLTLIVSMLGVFAVAEETTLPEAPKEMNIWVDKLFYDASNEMLKARIEAFGEEYGIKMNVELIANQDMMTKWTAAIETGNYPDMTLFGVQDVGDFAQKGLLRDLTDLLARIEAENGEMFPRVKDVMTIDGKCYTITRHVAAQTMLYREDMLKAAGWDTYPTTWKNTDRWPRM